MEDRIIRQAELSERLGVTRQTLWEWERQGKLPSRFKITEGGRVCGWLASEIDEWLKERAGKKEVLEEEEK
jgi:predicted DNA-binding transcriptional regulator AlpA